MVALLRSDVPIGSAFRQALADLIDGTSAFGARLDMKGHQPILKNMEGVQKRQKYTEIGRFIAKRYREIPANLATPCFEASEKYGESPENCQKQYYYHKRCYDWIGRARVPGSRYASMDDYRLEQIFHIADVHGHAPLLAAEYDAVTDAQEDFFRKGYGNILPGFAGSYSGADLETIVQAFVAYNSLLPRADG